MKYTILILAIFTVLYFVYKKKSIEEGLSQRGFIENQKNTSIDVTWGDDSASMKSCDIYTSSTGIGPYKDENGKWLVNNCMTGFTNENEDEDVCANINNGRSFLNHFGKIACETGKKLRKAIIKDNANTYLTKYSVNFINTEDCLENCVEPGDISYNSNCVANPSALSLAEQSNPIIRLDSSGNEKYYASCPHNCIRNIHSSNADRCRSDYHCGKCGIKLVEVKGEYKEEESEDGTIKKYFQLDELSNFSRYNVNNNIDTATGESIETNQENAADTSQSSLYTDTSDATIYNDIGNPSDIGMVDNSLEDYYRRQILDRDTENRLGGSEPRLRGMPKDGDGNVGYFNSVWAAFR